MIIVLMGVTGVGKTSVGRRLARELGWNFLDADDLHPAANLKKMHEGVPLTDADRAPWLDTVAAKLSEAESEGRDIVVACSALKRTYRERLRRSAHDARFVHLTGTEGLLSHRLRERTDHFMPPELLASQLKTLEPLGEGPAVDVSGPLDEVVQEVRRQLGI